MDKNLILQSDDRPSESVEVPEWGGTLKVRVMSGTERDAFEQHVSADSKGADGRSTMTNFRAKLLVRCLCDTDGKRLFADSDVEALGEKNGAVLDRLFALAKKLNRLNAEDVEEIRKN